MADTADSKSAGLTGREGSSPSSPTNLSDPYPPSYGLWPGKPGTTIY